VRAGKQRAKTSRSSLQNLSEDGAVKALVRGLRVLAAINNFQTATITRLESSLDLPKATIIRIVRTLILEGYVVEVPDGRGYRVARKAKELSRGLTAESPTYALVHPLLVQLAKRIKWPSEYLVRDGDDMVIEASNRNLAPIKIGIFEGRRFPIAASASGIAFLGSLPGAEQQSLIASLLDGDYAGRTTEAALRSKIRDFHEQGYASWSEEHLEPGLKVIAVPVIFEERPMGAVSAVFFDEAMAQSTLHDLIIPNLQQTCEQITSLFTNAELEP